MNNPDDSDELNSFMHLQASVELIKYYEDIIHHINVSIWQMIYPGKTDYEYQTQPLVHLREFLDEKDTLIELLQHRLDLLHSLFETMMTYTTTSDVKAGLELSEFKPTAEYVNNYIRYRRLAERNKNKRG